MKLDRLNRTILSVLQLDSALTNDQLAERVGLSASAVHRRIQALTASGVIERRIAIIDPAKVGSPGLFVVGVEVERERPELVQPLRTWFRNEPAVQQSYYVTGTSDYVLLVCASDMSSFDELMSRLMHDNPNVRRFTTNVVMTVVKRGLFVPVD